ncbi:MAG: hypothetical protein DBX55_04795 [Verrucomicrobia bacterium]|nr:MAG: hypothetical protein DBX55_04795 [Verrucomicrobiota bacterium]
MPAISPGRGGRGFERRLLKVKKLKPRRAAQEPPSATERFAPLPQDAGAKRSAVEKNPGRLREFRERKVRAAWRGGKRARKI